MYKSDVQTIALENSSVGDLILLFCKGIDIVFATNNKKFVGGVTIGDFVRQFKHKRNNILLEELINTRMTYITFLSEEQIFKDAKEIFGKSAKIHNIPVIDISGRPLFQINRIKNRNAAVNIENILTAIENGSVEVFLNLDEIKEIFLTGADYVSLQHTKDILEEQCQKLVLEKDISINVTDDLSKCFSINHLVKIISLSELGALYINKNAGKQADAISAKELMSFHRFSEIEKLDESAIISWKNIFGYKTVVFCSLNKYYLLLKEKIAQCGIQVCQVDQHIIFDNQFIGYLDVFCLQENSDKENFDAWDIVKLIECIEWLQQYKQITGHHLTRDEYIEIYICHLKGLHEEGFEIFLHEIHSEWEQRLDDMIKEKCDIQVINTCEKILPKKCIIDLASLKQKSIIVGRIGRGTYVLNKERVILFACEYEVYKMTSILCRNVYTFTCSNLGRAILGTCDGRTRVNFLENKEMFPDNFVKDMYGDEDYPIDKVIQDRSGCQIIKINDGYTKFSSNYHSKYFNTDMYGRRIVVNTPSKYSGTIWLVGRCIFSGYAVEDKDTFASYLQAKVNASNYSYRVINLSCEGSESIGYFNKILESGIHSNDIVILRTWINMTSQDFFKVIKLDLEEMNHHFSEKIWYWDDPGSHSGPEGYKFIAEKTFEIIKKDMVNNTKSYRFYVEKNLENKICNFITELTNRLRKESYLIYLLGRNANISDKNSIINNKYKAGAIVMNCNPFTFGHQYLIETASRIVDLLYVFVVEEDKSSFRFKDRFRMVQDGTKQYENVIVLPSGEFIISTVTFPGYFFKDTPTKKCYDDFLDLKIFAHYVAPALGISMRFIGEEPFDKVTAQYNHDMKTILGDAGIDVIEIPRKKYESEIISATKVRRLITEKDYMGLGKYVPETTMKYINMVEIEK